MKRKINKVVVLGSGVMGSRIACHFANIGCEVLLLDIVPKDAGEDSKSRNAVVNKALETAIKSNPAPLYSKHFHSRIKTGNFEDDLSKISEADWILEAVVENLEIKKSLFEKVEQHRKPGTLITSNTSGIPIGFMSKGRSEDFEKHFCGTHFFNPPRYLKLLEIIPGPKTDVKVLDFLMHYGDRYLGKTTVLCKDTPAFIANRIGVYSIMKTLEVMQKHELNVTQIDKLSGPVIGRPKSATFRTTDLVGLDTMIKVSDNLAMALQKDEQRSVFEVPDFVREMEKNDMLGDKSGKGFYLKTKDEEGKRKIQALNISSMEYEDQGKASFPTLEMTKPIEELPKRFPILLGGKDKASEFYRDTFYGLFSYASYRIPEIADELYKIDDAIKAGFGWELGVFETWDAAGVKNTIGAMKDAGAEPAPWVVEMLDAGFSSFYKIESGIKMYYDINKKDYVSIPGIEDFILLDTLRSEKIIWSNKGASLFDLGDGVLNLEFHTKMNTLGSEVIQGIHKGIDLAEEKYEGLIIGNQATNFSAGANLALLLMYAVEQEFDEINLMISQFQTTMMRARYSNIPVVVAPHGLSLGGGCELTLHADHVQAAAETYMGLVEFGVGLIPAGGGTKEMTLRTSKAYEQGDVELNALQNSFMNIAMAKVATSGVEAKDLGYIRTRDAITVNKDRQIADAKAAILYLIEEGYQRPAEVTDIKVHGKEAIAMFKAGIYGMLRGNYISEHDALIAEKLAYVMAGGDLSYPHFVSEQYLLDLEREAFLSLTGQKKTLERIQHMLNTGKPLRN